MRLTDILRDQHAQLYALLDELQRLGLSGPEGRERLQKARQAMLSHLSLEDNRLYPALQANPSTSGLASRYAEEMQQLTPALLAFSIPITRATRNRRRSRAAWASCWPCCSSASAVRKAGCTRRTKRTASRAACLRLRAGSVRSGDLCRGAARGERRLCVSSARPVSRGERAGATDRARGDARRSVAGLPFLPGLRATWPACRRLPMA
ncbi:hemerythrin domain-containing protein [Frateuria sp. GZRR33]|uniref:hemerythrin domain-containing protein n=1 Tax=Frateuria sp. GZRR33 TaxID=3351535 RepID=UPI003EDBEE22